MVQRPHTADDGLLAPYRSRHLLSRALRIERAYLENEYLQGRCNRRSRRRLAKLWGLRWKVFRALEALS